MTSRLQRILGVMLGVSAALAVIALRPGRAAAPPGPGVILSDCDAPLRAIVIQYVPEAPFAAEVYRSFLGQLDPGVTVYAMCPDRAAFDDLCARAGAAPGRLTPVLVGHPMTAWSRDRWVALRARDSQGHIVLLAPAEEAGAAHWPQRAGDALLAADLARAVGPGASTGIRVSAERSPLAFDGGDFVCDARTAFVAPGAIARNLQHTAHDLAGLRRELERVTGKRIVLLEGAPEHHAGMFMMAAGDGRVLVGDPSLARGLVPGAGADVIAGGADFSPATQATFDAVAGHAAAAGYAVTRIPLVPSADGKTFLTYLNVVIDQRPDGRRTVFMPVYRGREALNRAAARVWASLGYEVREVDCTAAYERFGSLRCLVNVLDRR